MEIYSPSNTNNLSLFLLRKVSKAYPVEKRRIGNNLTSKNREVTFKINGSGFVLEGKAIKNNNLPDAVLEIEVYINGNLYEVAKISTNNRIRRRELTWNYDLKEGKVWTGQRVKEAWNEGLDVITITDHIVSDHNKFYEIAKVQEDAIESLERPFYSRCEQA